MLKSESNLSETTDRAAALVEELRSRLEARREDGQEELDRELQAYFSAAANPPEKSLLNEIRDRVVEGVVDRIMRAWEEPQSQSSGAIEEAVVERLIERVLERLGSDSTATQRTGRVPERR